MVILQEVLEKKRGLEEPKYHQCQQKTLLGMRMHFPALTMLYMVKFHHFDGLEYLLSRCGVVCPQLSRYV